LKKLLAKIKSNDPIEVICVVGQPLIDWNEPDGREESDKTLAAKNIRVVLYNELIQNAHKAYSDFLSKKQDAGRVLDIIRSIDASEII
jgi:hypothetical protein